MAFFYFGSRQNSYYLKINPINLIYDELTLSSFVQNNEIVKMIQV